MLGHRSSNDEWIMTERISILDFYQVSFLPAPAILAYDHQLLQYLTISSKKIGEAKDVPWGGASAIKTTIFAASFLHSRSVKVAAKPEVTASGPSPPPAADLQLMTSHPVKVSSPIRPLRYSWTFGISDENGLVLYT